MLWDIDIYAFVIPLIVGVFRYKYLSPSLCLLFYVILICGVYDASSCYITLHYKNSSFLQNLFVPVYNLLWWLIYYLELRESGKIRVVLCASLSISTLLIVYNLFTPGDIHSFNGMLVCVSNFHITLLAMTYLLNLAFRSNEFRLDWHPFFIISCGLLIYHAFTIMIFASVNTLSNEASKQLWVFKGVTQILLYIIIAFSFYQQREVSLKR